MINPQEIIDVPEIFGCNVFSDAVMAKELPPATYKALRNTIDEGEPLTIEIANVVADAMKDWAVARGATHYTHWFQPLTDITAEKHDGFIEPDGHGGAIMSFSGKALIKGEPDASSFPSGGLRATFEARGYTAWDCTSPAFLKQDKAGVTLCIPTVFCSYTGEALDKKTPLLKSGEALNRQALRVLRALGDDKSSKVSASVGAEQEYFLIRRDHYMSRRDLKFTGRTLFGAMPPKGQELDDHYFGAIRGRLAEYMRDLDLELYKLGVYAKTKHNEVAPCQHELACIYEDVNTATDHNQLVMESMKRIALRYDLVCLLAEKPFDGVNGSGKHNNWSISTNTGVNLLDPGSTPEENARFLLFLCACIKAVDKYSGLYRASTASVGNDHRLGGNEAPPCIISMYLGDDLCEILDSIESGSLGEMKKKEPMQVGVTTLPRFSRDTTDRNRTSPVAYTGNKFEFRMVGSSASIAGINTIINTTVADVLGEFADVLEKSDDVNAAIHEIIVGVMRDHKRILFNGNGYSAEWVDEAARRGLPNIKSSIEAFGEYIKPEAVELFRRHNVYSENELYARFEIRVEKYVKITKIEAETMLSMTKGDILPAVSKSVTALSDAIIKQSAAGVEPGAEKKLLTRISEDKEKLFSEVEALETLVADADKEENFYARARVYRDRIIPSMKRLRVISDRLETILPRDSWPMLTYADILFYR